MATFAINPESGVGAPIRIRGTLDPDATGYYYQGGTLNNWRCYGRHDEAFWLWSDSSDQHFLTVALGDSGPGWWSNSNAGVLGLYDTADTYTGIPTVSMLGYHNPFGVGATVQRTNNEQWKARHTSKPMIPRQRHLNKAQRALGRAARLWKELSDAMQLIWVGDGLRPLTARNRERSLARGLRRWIQVQMPLLLAGLPLEASTKQRFPYEIADLRLGAIEDDGKRAYLEWRWKRNSLLEERVVLHVSQLRERLIGRVDVSQFARLIYTHDYPVNLQLPGWHYAFAPVPLLYHVQWGGSVQLYCRFELMDNPNPPVSAIGSLMTAEDWTDLYLFYG